MSPCSDTCDSQRVRKWKFNPTCYLLETFPDVSFTACYDAICAKFLSEPTYLAQMWIQGIVGILRRGKTSESIAKRFVLSGLRMRV
jgi:hypothetical protein